VPVVVVVVGSAHPGAGADFRAVVALLVADLLAGLALLVADVARVAGEAFFMPAFVVAVAFDVLAGAAFLAADFLAAAFLAVAFFAADFSAASR
jgi:hypothetical protein